MVTVRVGMPVLEQMGRMGVGIRAVCGSLLVTFCVSRRQHKMYCGYPRLCVYLSVCVYVCVCLSVCLQPYAHILHGPGCNLGAW